MIDIPKRTLAAAMVLARVRTLAQFNEVPDLEARYYIKRAEEVLAAADLSRAPRCTPEEYEAATRGS